MTFSFRRIGVCFQHVNIFLKRSDFEKSMAEIELKSGLTFRLSPNTVLKRIEIIIEWLHTGDRPYKDIRKYIGPRTDKASGQLEKAGWMRINKQIAADKCRIEAHVPQQALDSVAVITRCASGLAAALETLRFD